jgi:hypothetical protein
MFTADMGFLNYSIDCKLVLGKSSCASGIFFLSPQKILGITMTTMRADLRPIVEHIESCLELLRRRL